MDGRRPIRHRLRTRAAGPQVVSRQRPRMDLPTRDRASADVASVPAGESGVPAPGAERGQAPGGLTRLESLLRGRYAERVVAAGLLLALVVITFHFDARPRAQILDPLPNTIRGLAATAVLFGVGGFGLVRLLLPEALRDYELLWVLPTGGCAVGLTMTVLGFAHVPYRVSLGLVIAAGVAVGTWALRRRGGPRFEPRRLAWPAAV